MRAAASDTWLRYLSCPLPVLAIHVHPISTRSLVRSILPNRDSLSRAGTLFNGCKRQGHTSIKFRRAVSMYFRISSGVWTTMGYSPKVAIKPNLHTVVRDAPTLMLPSAKLPRPARSVNIHFSRYQGSREKRPARPKFPPFPASGAFILQ